MSTRTTSSPSWKKSRFVPPPPRISGFFHPHPSKAAYLGPSEISIFGKQTATLALPKNLQTHLAPVREEIESSFDEITAIVKSSDLPVGEKVARVGHHVQDKVQPLLAQTTATIQSYIDKYVGKAKEKEGEAKETAEEVKESANGAVEEATSSSS